MQNYLIAAILAFGMQTSSASAQEAAAPISGNVDETELRKMADVYPQADARNNPDYIPVPMTVSEWENMDRSERKRYAGLTIQALKKSPDFASCAILEPSSFEAAIDGFTQQGQVLMIAVASAAYMLCSDDFG